MNNFGFSQNEETSSKQAMFVESHNVGNTSTVLGFGNGSVSVDEDSVMQIPAFSAALNLIIGTIANLEIRLMKPDDSGVPQPIKDDTRIKLLNTQVNETMSSYTFKRILAKDILLYGQSLVLLEHNEKNKNKISALYVLKPDKTTINVYTYDGYKYFGSYEYNNANGTYAYDDSDIMNVIQNTDNGITAKGILENESDMLQLAINQNNFEKNLLGNSAMPSLAITSNRSVSQESMDKLKSRFTELYATAKNAGKAIFLDNGLDIKQTSIDPDKLQLTDSKRATLGEIARMFNIPETLVNSNANKYASNEQNNLQFFQYGLKPLLASMEAAFNKELLLEKEKDDGLFFQFDTDSIMQNTLQEKVTAIGALFDKGLISYDEARNKFGLENIDGEDFMTLGLGSVLYYPSTEKMMIPNMGVTLDKDGNVLSKGFDNDNNATEVIDKAQKAPNKNKQNLSHQHKADNNLLGGNTSE